MNEHFRENTGPTATVPPKLLPLYGLDRLGDARQVIVVEGEKCRLTRWLL